jgi:hypothetical protein
MAAIAVSEKRAERTALDEVVEVIEDAVEQHDSRSSSTPAQESSTCHRAGRSPRCSPC